MNQNCGKGEEILFQMIELCKLLNLRTVVTNGLFRGSSTVRTVKHCTSVT